MTTESLNKTLSRRRLIKNAGLALAGAVAAPAIHLGAYRAFADSPFTYSRRTMALMKESEIVDMLDGLSLGSNNDLSGARLPPNLVRLFQSSGITAFHNSRTSWGTVYEAKEIALDWFARWNGFVGRNTDVFIVVAKPQDIPGAKAAGKIAIIQGFQNSDHFRTLDDVQQFYDIGQRCSQLTYNTQNLIGSGSTERVDGGVTDYGASIIEKMNTVGMLVDTSHCGDRTTLDGIALSKKPIAITHSDCRALNNHPRGKTDEAIKALAGKGGVMGITGVLPFVSNKPIDQVTVQDVVDHIDHVVKLVGIEHVGIGTDADLWGHDAVTPEMSKLVRSRYKENYKLGAKLDIETFKGPTKIWNLTEALVGRGYSDAHIKLVLGGNFQRLFEAVWV